MIDSLEIPVAGGAGLLLIGLVAQTLKRLPGIDNPAAGSGISPRTIFYTADEAFLCSTAGGIFPVVQMDGRRVGRGTLESVTQRVRVRSWGRHLRGPEVTPVLN